jgi:hypothetical protein
MSQPVAHVSANISPVVGVFFGITLAFSIVALSVMGVLGHKKQITRDALWITGIVFVSLIVAG